MLIWEYNSVLADIMLVSVQSNRSVEQNLILATLSYQVHRCYILWGANRTLLSVLGSAAFVLNGK